MFRSAKLFVVVKNHLLSVPLDDIKVDEIMNVLDRKSVYHSMMGIATDCHWIPCMGLSTVGLWVHQVCKKL